MIGSHISKCISTGLIIQAIGATAFCDEKPDPIYYSVKCNTQLDPLKTPEIQSNLLQATDFQSETGDKRVIKVSGLGMDYVLDEIKNPKCSRYAYREKKELVDNYPESKYPSMPQRRDTSYGGLHYKEGEPLEYYPPIVSFSEVTKIVIAERNWNSIRFMPSKSRKDFTCLKESSSVMPLTSKEEAHTFLAQLFVKSKFEESLGTEVALHPGTYTHGECVMIEDE